MNQFTIKSMLIIQGLILPFMVVMTPWSFLMHPLLCTTMNGIGMGLHGIEEFNKAYTRPVKWINIACLIIAIWLVMM